MTDRPPGLLTPKRLVSGFLVLVLVIAALTARVVIAGELEIAASTQALIAGDAREATVRARTAALWYAPGAPHVRVAYERLLALGEAAEKKQNREVALLAYRSVRTASESTRWLITPHADDARRANEAVARIDATATRPPSQGLEPAQVIEKTELELLSRDVGPHRDWIVALAIAFVTWASGLAWILFRAIDESGKVAWSRAGLGLGLSLLGMTLWTVALYFA